MKQTKISAIRGLVGILMAFFWLWLSVAKGQAASPPLPPSNAASNEAPNVTRRVNCDAGQTIQEAVNNSNNGDTVLVSGTCFENVTVGAGRTNITLDGQGAATINGLDPSATTVSVQGTRISIKGFTITGGRNGITAAGARRLTIQSCNVEATGNNGVLFAQDSSGTVDSCTIQNNPRNGIDIQDGGSARVTNSTISGNGRRGIQVSNGGSANLTGNNITNNQEDGVNIGNGSTAFLTGNTISNNGRIGLSLITGTGVISSGNTITSNGNAGISVSASSIQIGGPGTSPNSIGANGFTPQPNVGPLGGIFADLASVVRIFSSATINGNSGNGLTLQSRSTAGFITTPISSVNNNTGDGIQLTLGGAVTGVSKVTASGNGGFGLQCTDGESSFQGSAAGITGNTAGDVSASCTGF